MRLLGVRNGFLLAMIVAVMGSKAFAFDISKAVTGSWYNAAQSGHGVILEVLPDDKMLAYWFSYDTEGNQAWFVGTGDIDGNSASMKLTKTKGGQFGSGFDPSSVKREDWGDLTVSFSSCHSGTVVYDTLYGAGSLSIERLTSVDGLACPDEGGSGDESGSVGEFQGIIIESETFAPSPLLPLLCEVTVRVMNPTSTSKQVYLFYRGYNSSNIVVDDAVVSFLSMPAGSTAIKNGVFPFTSCSEISRIELNSGSSFVR